MKVIVLTGDSSSGKTTTLNIVYNEVISLGGTSTNKQTLGGNPKDFSDIVNWMGKKIAFYTMGDYSKYLIDASKKYDASGIDILVCASNKRFVKPLSALSNYSCHVVPKTIVPTGGTLRDLINQLDAGLIISHI